MINYLEEKVARYCEERKKRDISTNIYDVHNEFEVDWWNLSAFLYATWLKKNSTFETKELSEQEW